MFQDYRDYKDYMDERFEALNEGLISEPTAEDWEKYYKDMEEEGHDT